MGELVEKGGEVGPEMDHGDRDVVRPRMLVWEMQRTAVDGGGGPLGLGSSGWRAGGVKGVSGGAWGSVRLYGAGVKI